MSDEKKIRLLDFIDKSDLQNLQDALAFTYDVASVIKTAEGENITEHSNYCEVCNLINSTEKGAAKCLESNLMFSERVAKSMQPEVMHCLTCGFLEASAPIMIDGQHVASWHISYKNLGITDDALRRLAGEIGLEKESLVKAFDPSHTITEEQFRRLANLLWLIANRISNESYSAHIAKKALKEQERLQRQLEEKNRELRKLASQSLVSEEKTRKQIASELHDSIGHSLVSLKRDLKSHVKTHPECSDVEKCCADIEEIINQTRSLTFKLSSPLLYDFGVSVALEDLAERIFKPEGIQFVLTDHCEDLKIPENFKIVLYRMSRELCYNVLKHAEATRVELDLYYKSGAVIVILKDDGKGFDTNAPRQGLGLFGVRERLKYYGGFIRIRSSASRGTRITVRLPLEEGDV